MTTTGDVPDDTAADPAGDVGGAAEIIGHRWLLVSIDGETSESEDGGTQPPDLTFATDGSLSGSTGVNRLHGSYALVDGVLSTEGLATTRMAGPPAAMDIERRLLAVLGSQCHVELRDGQLELTTDGGETLVFSTSAGAQPHRAQLTGSVLYRERIAMPAEAIITVQLLDVSRMDVAADVLGAATIERPPNVPVPFVIEYDASAVSEGNTYAVAASIRVADELRWYSATQHQVLTHGKPSTDVEVVVEQV